MTCFLGHNCTLGSFKCCREEGVMHISQRYTDMNYLWTDITTVTTKCVLCIQNFSLCVEVV